MGAKGHAMTLTFGDSVQAGKVKSLVDEAGNRMPAAKVLVVHGLQRVLGDQLGADVSPVAARVTVSELCRLYLTALAASPQAA